MSQARFVAISNPREPNAGGHDVMALKQWLDEFEDLKFIVVDENTETCRCGRDCDLLRGCLLDGLI